mgnify:CR=1 FL=1
MIINIKLVGLFQIGHFKQMDRIFPAGITAQGIIDDLQLPQVHIGTILINGVHTGRDTELFDGDKLVILPLLGGG